MRCQSIALVAALALAAHSSLPYPVAVAVAVMPSLVLPELFLCADGGGTSVTIAIASSDGAILARGSAGPCNV